MASGTDRSNGFVVLAATVLCALCWGFGAQLHPVWWLAWLAPLPVLWLATRVRARRAAAAAFVAFSLGGLGQWHYLHDLLRLPPLAMGLAACGPALIFTLAVLVYRRLAMRGHHVAAALSVPVLWTAIWYLNGTWLPDGTWSNLAYTQLDALPLIQIAAVTGLWGIGFLVMLAPATAAVACNPAAPPHVRLRVASLGAGVIALALGYGAWRLQAADGGTPVNIGLVSLAGPVHPPLSEREGQQLVQRYVAAVAQLAGQGARIVVMPEVALSVSTPDLPVLNALARQHGITLVTGVDHRPAGGPERNMSLAFHSGSGAPTTYTKQHLVTGFEARFTPGRESTLLEGSPRIGLLICKDMDFPATSRVCAAQDAQLLLVPAWDFHADDWLHSRMAMLRGVESGFAMARAARDGRLTLSDDRGRVLAETSSVQQDAQLVGSLPLRDTRTPYARWGDWFAWLDLAALAILLGLALRPWRR